MCAQKLRICKEEGNSVFGIWTLLWTLKSTLPTTFLEEQKLIFLIYSFCVFVKLAVKAK